MQKRLLEYKAHYTRSDQTALKVQAWRIIQHRNIYEEIIHERRAFNAHKTNARNAPEHSVHK